MPACASQNMGRDLRLQVLQASLLLQPKAGTERQTRIGKDAMPLYDNGHAFVSK